MVSNKGKIKVQDGVEIVGQSSGKSKFGKAFNSDRLAKLNEVRKVKV